MPDLSNSQFYQFDQFDPEEIKKKSKELKEKFFQGHQKSQLKHKNGIVFIGNSRAGKSTLSGQMSGIKMRKVIQKGTVVIEPLEEKYRKQKNLIQHTFTSVTSYPNIHEMQINGQFYTVVDLPGFKDTSYQKELCNWGYIKDILQKLNKVLFVMVLQVHSQSLSIKQDELTMMKRFMQAFPTDKPLEPKKNLCMIINFVQNIETEKKQIAMKQKIIKQLEQKLQAEQIKSFYSNSIQSNRLLLIQRAREDNNQQYVIPKLLPFIKSNINRLQKPQSSQYKINLTINQNQKSQELRVVITYFVSQTIKKIVQKIDVYKELLSQLLEKLSKTEGIICGKIDYIKLQNYHRKNKLSAFRQIQFVKQEYSGKQSNIMKSNQQSIQESILDILDYFKVMTQSDKLLQKDKTNQQFGLMNKQKQKQYLLHFKQFLNNSLETIIKFFELTCKLCEKFFNKMSHDELQVITEDVKKSIYFDFQNLNYLVENVQQYMIGGKNTQKVSSLDQFETKFCQAYNDEINRISKFKSNLIKYFDVIIKKNDSQLIGKVNLGILNRLREICDHIQSKKQALKCSILIYKCSHKKLHNQIFFTNPQLLYSLINEIRKIQLKKDQLDQIDDWKKAQQDWDLIKGNNYIFLLNFLTKTGYKNKRELVKYYLNIKQFDEVINLLKNIIEDVEHDAFNRLHAYDMCITTNQKMMESWYLPGAIECCKLAEKLYVYNDKTRVTNAKLAYINILRKVIVQDPTAMINEYQNSIKASPWTQIQDSNYQSLLNIVIQHIQDSHIMKDKKSDRNQKERNSVDKSPLSHSQVTLKSTPPVKKFIGFKTFGK